MKNNLGRASGLALIVGSILMVFTMVLHPAGGNINHLFKVINMIMITHSVAILTVPILLFGFWGLTHRLGDDKIFQQ